MKQDSKNQKKKRGSKESNELSSQKNDVEDTKIKLIAWILLSLGIGLCIIAAVICIILAVNKQNNNIVMDIDRDFSYVTADTIDENSLNFNFSLERFGKIADAFQPPQLKGGCIERSCRIECSDNDNIYMDTADVMNSSHCDVFVALVVMNQMQLSIEDMWIDMKSTVLKIVLGRSQFTAIQNGAFSSPMFAKVFHMTWVDLQLEKLSNGALLGLYSLRKLEIDFKIPNVSLTFLQPVQVTLTHLRLNSGITFKSNLSVFDNIYLENLIHLDLSSNSFSGPLSKHIFSGTPNVTYLYIKFCHITAIEDTAFQDLGKLILVDLRHNLLTHLSADVFHIAGTHLLVEIEPNNWQCDCQLRSLIEFYNENKSVFMSVPYCRMPYNLYGKSFDKLNEQELICVPETETETPNNGIPITDPTIDSKEEKSSESNFFNNDEEIPTSDTAFGAILQFSCSQAIDLDKTIVDNTLKRDIIFESHEKEYAAFSGKFVFEPPIYDLNLHLFENRSVRASIDEHISVQLNIIWFTDEPENNEHVISTHQIDYNCMQYEEPYLIIDSLQQNHTYTFCMMPAEYLVISPLFCQPLYVPSKKGINDTSDIWIAEDEKQFTIAMLCLVFFISIMFGAIFAYLGIKSFPHLLEGSKNVLVIKESDKTCCISTIAESEYIKAPFNKPYNHANSFKTGHIKSSDISTRTSGTELPSLISLRSSSTCFEESFSCTDVQTMDYEMPIRFKSDVNGKCNLNNYSDRPSCPPPLPKRNSNISLILEEKPTSSQNT